MRILRSFLLFFLTLGIVGLIVFLSARELLLYIGVKKISSSLNHLKQLEAKDQFVGDCAIRGATRVAGESFILYQLKFENNKDYVLEAICNGFSLSPINIGHDSLPYLVEKKPGDSGILWGDYSSGVRLSMLGRTAMIYVEDRMIISRYSDDVNIDISSKQPIASCENYGYHCCQDDFDKGVGEKLLTVTDCPKSCYSSCEARPVVLSFNSQPFVDQNTKKLVLKSGEEATFFYVISDSQEYSFSGYESNDILRLFQFFYSSFSNMFLSDHSKMKKIDPQVIISFGDGTKESFKELQGSTSHVYFCNNPQGCEYQAEISSSNAKGIESAKSVLSKINVTVN